MNFRRMAAIVGRSSVIAGALGAANLSTAQEAPEERLIAPMGGLTMSSDSDGFDSLRTRAGVLYPYANPWRYSGVAVQSTRYAQGDFRNTVGGVVGFYRDQRRDTLAGVDVEAGVVRVANKLRPVGDASWRFVPASGTAIDLMASAELVETRKALERGIGTVFVGAGVERQFSPRFTATGLAGWQTFNDGNARNHLRARLIWLAIPDDGVTLQLRLRHFGSRKADVDGAYFNPEKYRQWLGVAAIRKRSAGWYYSAALGAGREQTEGLGSRASYLAEARAETTIMRDSKLVLHGGYYRSAAGVVDNPNYAYRQFGASLVVPLH
ncbi:MAG: hypothetical protein V4857_06430 [Pseudomonadota bacterium]